MKSTLKDFAGLWVALTEQETVGGVGGTVSDAIHAARVAWPKERLRIVFISEYPPYLPLPAWPLNPLRALASDVELWLVGGAVRDLLLGKEPDDWDFTMPGNAVRFARKVADHMQGDFYVLDAERGSGRAIVNPPYGDRPIHLDFAQVRGTSIEEDLYARDFTINAIAMTVDGRIVDPTQGMEDLQGSRLAMVQQDALAHDPIRLLRAVRLSRQLCLSIEKQTADAIHQLAPAITSVAEERIQAELTKLLKVPEPDQALVALKAHDLLPHLFPEVANLTSDRWDHTLRVLRALSWLTRAMHRPLGDADHFPAKDTREIPSWVSEDLRTSVGDLLSEWIDYLDEEVNRGLSRDHLLRWAALFHAVGRSDSVGEADHERSDGARDVSAVASRCRELRLPNDALELITSVVGYTCTPEALVRLTDHRRSIYRYFQQTGKNGLAVLWFSLADALASSDLCPDRTNWLRVLSAIRRVFRAYFQRYEEVIAPDPLLGGRDLIRLGLEPGPQLGAALRWLVESQAAGEIRDRDQAVAEISHRYLSPPASFSVDGDVQ
jgi:tRNA nucleotidyltransferase/poly(A) polymerase